MKLGKATVTALAIVPQVGLLILAIGVTNRLMEGSGVAARIAALAAALLLLGLAYTRAARKWPDVFSDRVQLRGPELNFSRAGVLVSVIACWAAALVFILGLKTFGQSQPLLWPFVVLIGYLLLVAAIHLMESAWLRQDSERETT